MDHAIDSAKGEPPARPQSPDLVTFADAIGKLDELVRVLSRTLSPAKAWERQLAARLAEADRLLQLLRLTVAMERQDEEVRDVASQLCSECRALSLAIGGSRADITTKQAVRLIAGLAASARDALAKLERAAPPATGA